MCGHAATHAGEALVGWQLLGSGMPPVVASIVLITDDAAWRERTAAFLAAEGYLVRTDVDVDARWADAVILDLALASRSAIDVCIAWRTRATTPLLAVASGDDEAIVLDAYAAGADQVASMDSTDRQLLARLRSVLRRSPLRRNAPRPAVGSAGPPIVLDADQLVAVIAGTPVPMTQQEFDFLDLLIEREGRVVSRAELLSSLGVPPANGRALDFFVRRLREKLERVDARRRIRAIRGVGFRFDAVGEAER